MANGKEEEGLVFPFKLAGNEGLDGRRDGLGGQEPSRGREDGGEEEM